MTSEAALITGNYRI